MKDSDLNFMMALVNYTVEIIHLLLTEFLCSIQAIAQIACTFVSMGTCLLRHVSNKLIFSLLMIGIQFAQKSFFDT